MQRLDPKTKKPTNVMIRLTNDQVQHLDKKSKNRSEYIRRLIDQEIYEENVNNDRPKLDTYDDARTYFGNSGIEGWEWFEGFSEKEFCMFLFRKSDGELTFKELLTSYLIMKDQDPDDYDY